MTPYRVAVPGRPVVIDGRYYLAYREPPILLVDQPKGGFQSVMHAETFLAGRVNMDWKLGQQYIVVQAGQIEQVGSE